MLPDLKLALRLQDLDTRVVELEREIATLPKHIVEIEKKLVSHERKLEADRAALAANQKERKKCEGDIQVQEVKISKLKDQMTLAKTNDQYRAFQHEIEFCEKEIRKSEDRILELMGESEPLEKNVKTAEVSLKAEKQQVAAETLTARERTAADRKALADLQAERKDIVGRIGAGLYRQYERVRRTRNNSALAEAVEGRCMACQMTMRPQHFLDLKKDDQILHCENCQRILFYNPPVAMEDLGAEPAPIAQPESGR